jgi:hypothetical protein
MLNYTTQRSGSWSDTTANSPWYTGTLPAPVPGAGDSVVIADGHTVTIPDGYNAVIGNSPAAAGVVLQVNGTGALVIGAGASGSLQVLGSVAFANPPYASFNTLTVNAGGTLFIDGTGNVGQRYTLGIGWDTRVRFNGTTGAHVTVKSTAAGGATPAVAVATGGYYSGGMIATYTDFQYLGDSGTQAWLTALNENNAGTPSLDFLFVLDHCTLDHCGQFHGYAATACAGARFEVTNCITTNSLTDGSSFWILYYGPNEYPQTGGGTFLATGNTFDATPRFSPVNGLTCNNNIFDNGFYAYPGGWPTSPWASFDSNWIRLTTATDLQEFYGDTTNSFIWYNSPATSNAHMCGFSTIGGLSTAALNITGNVLLSDQTDHQTRGMIVADLATTGAHVNVRFNISLPNGTDGGSADFCYSLGNSTNGNLYVEHNTVCLERHMGTLVGHLQTVADSSNRFKSWKSNLFWAATGNPAGSGPDTVIANQTDGASQALTDLLPASVVDRNAHYKINGTFATGGAYTNQGNGYGENCTTTPGATDVFLDASGGPQFKLANAGTVTWNALQAWDAHVSHRDVYASGSSTNVRTQMLARTAGYTTAALLAFIRAAYQPMNSAVSAAYDATHAFSGDTSTLDAAGNALGGTIGAMAYLSAGATSYTLGGPSSGTVNSASTNFTVTPVGGNATTTITMHSTGAGTFSPTTLTFSGTSAAQTFTYTPTSITGSPHTISTTASPALGSDPAGIAYTVHASFTLTAPSPTSGDVAIASGNFTVTPVGGNYTGTITIAPSGGGLSTPIVLTWSASAAAQTFTIAPPLIGVVTLTPTNSGSLTNPAPVTYTGLIQLGKVTVLPLTADNGGIQPGPDLTPDLGGYLPFQTGPLSEFMRDIVGDAVDATSAALMACYQPGAPLGNGGADWTVVKIHVDGGGPDYLQYGTPFMVVDSTTQGFLPISYANVNSDGGEYYGTESDPGPMPIPLSAPIQAVIGAAPAVQQASDSHVVVLDRATHKLYELYKAYQVGGLWYAGAGAVFDLSTGGGGYTIAATNSTSPNLPSSGSLRKSGWTSVDAAGLCIFPFLVRYDEAVLRGVIKHAIRATFNANRTVARYQWPARHFAGTTQPNSFPFGARLRMTSAYYTANASSFTGAARVVVEAMRHYGLVNMDIGRDFDTAFVQDSRWDQANLLTLQNIPASAFEVLQIKPGFSVGVTSNTVTIGSAITVTFTHLPAGDTNYFTDFYASEDGGATFLFGLTFVAVGSITMSEANPAVVYTYTPQSTGVKQIQAHLDPYGRLEPASQTVTVNLVSTTSTKDGDWSDGTVWSNGLPSASKMAIVNHNVAVRADATVGDGSNTTVLDCSTGFLTIVGCKLTVRGNATFGASYFADSHTGSLLKLTITSATGFPAGLELDGNAGVTPIVQVGQYSKVTATGTAADRCYIRTKSGSAGNHGYFVGWGPGSHFHADLRYCDVSRLGDASNAGMGNIALINAGAVTFSMDHCVVDSCGSLPNLAISDGSTVYSSTYCKWTNCAAFATNVYATVANTTGTRAVNYCAFFGTPFFNQAQDLTISHNYFDHELQSTHSYPVWAAFDDNFVQKTTVNETQTNGNVTNSFWLYAPTGDVPTNSGFYHVSKYASTLHQGSVFQYVGTYNTNGAVNITEGATSDHVVTILNNIILPNSAGDSSGALTQGFNNKDDAGKVTTVAEHNTVAVGTTAPIVLTSFDYSGPPYAERVDQLLSARSNLFWRTGAAPGIGLYAVQNASGYVPLTDAIRAVNCDYNAYCSFDAVAAGAWSGTSGATTCTDGTVYNSPMSGATAPGAHDVHLGAVANVTTLGPKFVDPTRTIQTWDTSLGGAGTVANAVAKLQIQSFPAATGYDSRYTTAALLAYVRGGFTPTNPVVQNASYPGDLSTDIGAVSFTAAATATSYTLAGPATGTVAVASTNFTVTPNGPYTGQITPSDGGAGGAFTPPSLVWAGTADPKTFT